MELGLTGPWWKSSACRRWFAGLVALAGCTAFLPRVRAEAPRESDLKAVLILNFTQFVEWPEKAFVDAKAPLVIGVFHRDPFGKALEAIVTGERVDGRPIQVRRFRSPSDIRDCQILFVSEHQKDDLPRILASVKGKPILTVGDFEGFALRGGMMRLMKTPDEKIRLRINLEAVKASGLTVSAKLLRVAEVVIPDGN